MCCSEESRQYRTQSFQDWIWLDVVGGRSNRSPPHSKALGQQGNHNNIFRYHCADKCAHIGGCWVEHRCSTGSFCRFGIQARRVQSAPPCSKSGEVISEITYNETHHWERLLTRSTNRSSFTTLLHSKAFPTYHQSIFDQVIMELSKVLFLSLAFVTTTTFMFTAPVAEPANIEAVNVVVKGWRHSPRLTYPFPMLTAPLCKG